MTIFSKWDYQVSQAMHDRESYWSGDLCIGQIRIPICLYGEMALENCFFIGVKNC